MPMLLAEVRHTDCVIDVACWLLTHRSAALRQKRSPARHFRVCVSAGQDRAAGPCPLVIWRRRATGFQRLCAFPTRFDSLPKTILSTRRQYASTTFGFSEDSPLVTCISGPNSESVAVRLTII